MAQRRKLQSSSDVTVFVPTNAAFDAAGDAITRYFDTDAWSNLFIQRVIKYHIIEGTVLLSTDLVDGQIVITPSPATTIPSDVTVSLNDPPTLDGPSIVPERSNSINAATHRRQQLAGANSNTRSRGLGLFPSPTVAKRKTSLVQIESVHLRATRRQ
jgi:uncharacterized surface protein with fasciclin (FAS1) repeats